LRLHEALSQARARLVAAGLPPDAAAADVDVLARHALGWDRARLIAEQQAPAPEGFDTRFAELIERRERREPTAYITGTREFWGLDLKVTPAVLIPRPETELIIEEALPLVRKMAAPLIADIGTGSGCLAVALAHELPAARIIATDLSPTALAIAAENAMRHGVDGRIRFVETSYLDGQDSGFDLIAANPPYVRNGDKPGLSRDVRHEPDVALFGGDDGLRDVEGVLATAARKLKPGGWLLMEFGLGQEEGVRHLMAARSTLRLDRVRDDLQGIARTAIIQRR
jgi:release factor glutamine methyltransferase